MDIAVFAVLVATFLPCSDVQGIMDAIRSDRYLTSETRTEIVEMLLNETPECELDEGSKL